MTLCSHLRLCCYLLNSHFAPLLNACPAGGRYQRITPGAAHEQAAHYSEQDKAAHIHMLQTEPRRVAAAARERGGHPLEEALPCLESLTRAALGLEPDAEVRTIDASSKGGHFAAHHSKTIRGIVDVVVT